MRAVAVDVLRVRPRDQAALRARMPRAGGDVVGIEQKRETVVENLIAGPMRHEQKLLEKPGDVRPMPFRRACVRHRLHDLVFGREIGGAPLGFASDDTEGVDPQGALVPRSGAWRRRPRCDPRHAALSVSEFRRRDSAGGPLAAAGNTSDSANSSMMPMEPRAALFCPL